MSSAWLDSLRDVPEIGASPSTLLGALVSGPPLVPYGLIRQARRAVFGSGSLYLEAMLCDSDLVETLSKDGVELAREFRAFAQRTLRERVMAGAIPVAELREANRCEHLQMSSLLLLEEQLVWAYVSQPDPAPECNRLLSDCLLSIVREDRHRILDWAAGALHRLPDLVVATQAAWLLSELCNALHRETRKLTPPSVEQLEPGLLQEIAPLLPPVLVGFYRDGTTLSLGPINRLRRTAFAVPGIALQPVTVTWSDTEPADGPDAGGDADQERYGQRRELTVDVTGHVGLIPVGRSAVRLRTVAGAVISLPSFGSGTKAPELVELDNSLDLMEDAWRNARSMTAVVIRTISKTSAIVRFVNAWAISAHLRFDRSYLQETGVNSWSLVGSQIDVKISSFERQYQRILCRPASPMPWSAGILVPGMRVEARFINMARFGLFANVPTTEQGFEGPTIGGLLHFSELPSRWINRVNLLKRGDLLRLKVAIVDLERERLSLKPADDDIIDTLSMLPEGKIITGRVAKIVGFGVFVELLLGYEALLHNSEIAAGREFTLGEELRVQVVKVDYERYRVSLATEPRLPAGAPSRAINLKQHEDNADPTTAKLPEERVRAVRSGPLSPEAIAEFLRQRLRQLHEPIKLGGLAMDVQLEFGPDIAGDWLGYEKFKLMLLALVPEATVYAYDSSRVNPL